VAVTIIDDVSILQNCDLVELHCNSKQAPQMAPSLNNGVLNAAVSIPYP
jgi:hypothetical protein